MIDVHAARWSATDAYEVLDTARKFENWERNQAAWLGLGAAAQLALTLGIAEIERQVSNLADQLRRELHNPDRHIKVMDKGKRLSGIVSFMVEGIGAEKIKQELVASDCFITVAGVVSTRFDMERRGVSAVCRASPHYYNTPEEVQQFAAIVQRCIDRE